MKTHVLHVHKVVQYYFRVTWFYVTWHLRTYHKVNYCFKELFSGEYHFDKSETSLQVWWNWNYCKVWVQNHLHMKSYDMLHMICNSIGPRDPVDPIHAPGSVGARAGWFGAPHNIQIEKYRTNSHRPVREPSGAWIPDWPYQFFGVKDSQDSTRHNYTMIPKRAENFAKNITTRIRFGKENHLDEFATNCNITSSGTLPVTIWKRILSVWSRLDKGPVWPTQNFEDWDQFLNTVILIV